MLTSLTRVARQRGGAPNQIPDRQQPVGDPLLDAKARRAYLSASEMTLWRWAQDFGFPPPDVVIGRRRFWLLSTIDRWLAQRIDAHKQRPSNPKK
jgi:predicted DNA-binding transcriptional regulator AlpA